VNDKPKPSFSWDQIDALRTEAGLAYDAPEGAVTVYDWAKRYGLTRKGAQNQTAALVRAGKLKAGWALRNGTRLRVYWPA